MNLSLLPGVVTKGEIAGASSSSVVSPSTDSDLAADFGQLLNEQLSQLLSRQDDIALKNPSALPNHSASEHAASNNSTLNPLLAGLSERGETLPDGLLHAGSSEINSAPALTLATELADQTNAHTALQNLLAMLPQQGASTAEQSASDAHAETSAALATEFADQNNSQPLLQTLPPLAMTAPLHSQNLLADRQTTSQRLQADKEPGSLLTAARSGNLSSIAVSSTAASSSSTASLTTASTADKAAHSDNPLLASDSPIKQHIAQPKLTAQDIQEAERTASVITAKDSLIPAERPAAPDKMLSTAQQLTPSMLATPSPLNTATAPAMAHATLTAPLGSQEWQQSLGQQVLLFNRNGQQRAELYLHPQELGALQISLKIDDNQAQLHFSSAHGQVRAALEAALPSLRSALAESGIQLGQTSVGSEEASQRQLAQQHSQQTFNGGSPFDETSTADATTLTPLATPVTLQRLATETGSVDIFA